MSEGYLVRRGGSGGGTGDLAIFTGSTLPTNEPYGVYANTGIRNVNGIIVDMPVDFQYSLLTYVNTFNPRGIGINDEETQGVFFYGGNDIKLYDIASNSVSVVNTIANTPETNNSWCYLGENVYVGTRGYNNVQYMHKLDVDSKVITDLANRNLGNGFGAFESTIIQNNTVAQFLFGSWYSSTSVPTVLQVDLLSNIQSVFWSGNNYRLQISAWCPDYAKDGSWWIIYTAISADGGTKYSTTFINSNGQTGELPGKDWFRGKPGICFSFNGYLFCGGTMLPETSNEYTGIGYSREDKSTPTIIGFGDAAEVPIEFFRTNPWYSCGFTTTSPTSAWWVSDTALNRFVISPNTYPNNYVVIRLSNVAENMATIVSSDEQQVNIPVQGVYYQDGDNLISLEGSVRLLDGSWQTIT